MCKHNWIKALPDSNEVADDLRVDYVVVKMLSKIGDMFFCTKCGKTGHAIKSHRGGIRVHYYSDGYFVNKANELRKRFGFPLLNSELNPQECDATKAQSMDEPLLPNKKS